MSIKDSGGFNVMRRPDLDVSGMIGKALKEDA
jgi:hypothetical protein